MTPARVTKQPRPTPRPDTADDGLCIRVPASATTLAGFRAWSQSEDFPERGVITYLGGEIIIDMSPERLSSHNAVKTEITRVLSTLVVEQDLGQFYADRARFVHEEAEVSNEPDAMFVAWENFTSGRVRMVPTKDEDDFGELEGTPDWVLEIVSPSSVGKDTDRLRKRYHAAGIPEYWLIDARGDEVRFEILLHEPADYRAAPARAGWRRSSVFGKRFRLARFNNRIGVRAYRLEMK